ncbi:VWA domain-containing protein [Candidatus Peregrinibacteria bacterium]|nr:VWA domain-containing protein [Candidatus Peregrinibacteria bacterium]
MNRKSFYLPLSLVLVLLLGGCGFLGKSPAKSVEKASDSPKTAQVQGSKPSQPSKDGQTPPSESKSPSVPKKPLPPESVTQMELILDDSGSMWGQVEGKAKIDVAKDSMNKIIDDLKTKDKLQVALRIYAHQNKECTNSVVEMPMGKIDAEGMKAKIKDLKPLGSTPIAYSLTESVKDFKKDLTGERVVVLVTDGLESCNGDPCAVAKALKEGGVISQLHVVGFGLTKTELETLKCIVDPFKGQVVGANNSTEFLKAMQTILNKALESNVELTGKSQNGKPVYMNVKVSQGGKVVKEEHGSTIAMMLPPGLYDIEAESSDGISATPIKGLEVKADQVSKKELLFVQGNLTVKIIGVDGKPLEASDIMVFTAGKPEQIAGDNWKSETTFTVKPDTYDLKAVNGATQAEAWVKNFEVKEGEPVSKTISFAQGSLKVSVVGNDGKPLEARELCAYAAGKPDNPVECNNWVTTHEFKLQPGLYDIYVQNGGTSEVSWAKGVEVKALETVSRTVGFGEGTLKVSVLDTKKNPEEASDITIYPKGDHTNSVTANNWVDTADFPLKPGLYDVHVIHGKSRAEKWIEGVEISSGASVARSVSFELTKLTVKVSKEASDITLYKSGTDEVVNGDNWKSETEFWQIPGTYDLMATDPETQESKWVKGIQLKDGDHVTKTVDL